MHADFRRLKTKNQRASASQFLAQSWALLISDKVKLELLSSIPRRLRMKAQTRSLRFTSLLFLAALLLSGVGAIFIYTPAHATTGFVTRSGTNFMLGGSTYYFGGTNNYYLLYKSNYMVDDLLTNAANNSFKVVRTWGYLDIGNQDGSNSVDGSGLKDGIYFQYWNGSAPAYNDGATGLQKLDYIIYKAGLLNLRLIIP